MKKKAWGGRFEKEMDKLAEEYSESVSFDTRLAKYDVQGSVAHAKMLAHTGIITPEDGEQIVAGLAMVRGLLVQMSTGEGKTLCAVPVASLLALAGRGRPAERH